MSALGQWYENAIYQLTHTLIILLARFCHAWGGRDYPLDWGLTFFSMLLSPSFFLLGDRVGELLDPHLSAILDTFSNISGLDLKNRGSALVAKVRGSPRVHLPPPPGLHEVA